MRRQLTAIQSPCPCPVIAVPLEWPLQGVQVHAHPDLLSVSLRESHLYASRWTCILLPDSPGPRPTLHAL